MIDRRIGRRAAANPHRGLRSAIRAAASIIVMAIATIGWPADVASKGPQISVVPSQPVPGQRVSVRGSGFCPAPCSPVTVTVDGSVAMGNVAVGDNGTFSVEVALTPVAGTSTIVASQTEGGGGSREATAIVRVVASDQTQGPPPPAATAPPTSTIPPMETESSPPATSSPTNSPLVSPSPTASESESPSLSGPPGPTASSDAPMSPSGGIGSSGVVVALLAIAAALATAAAWLKRRARQGSR